MSKEQEEKEKEEKGTEREGKVFNSHKTSTRHENSIYTHIHTYMCVYMYGIYSVNIIKIFLFRDKIYTILCDIYHICVITYMRDISIYMYIV